MTATARESTSEAIGCEGIWKSYGDCVSNADVSFSVRRESAHALVGENGAGKSTLMKILYGLVAPDRGSIRIGGEKIAHPSVEESIARGVGMVHQHFMLVPTLTVAENIVLGREPMRRGLLDLDSAIRGVEEVAQKHGLAIDPRRRVGDLSVGEAQRVEILKVLYRGARTLILDEPTAMLTPLEVGPLLEMLRGLVENGSTVIIVTHKLGEVLALADEVTVLRQGRVVERCDTKGLTAEALSHALIGRAIAAMPARAARVLAEPSFALDDLHLRRDEGSAGLDGISLAIAPGEIVGVAGVEGNGQRELALIAAGLRRPDRGAVRIDGADCTALGIAARHAIGVAYVPEDRHEEGLLLDSTLWENLYLGREAAFGSSPIIPRARVIADSQIALTDFDVRPPDVEARARNLSGGNQQKVVIARELSRRPRVLVCAQPTRGVDIGAIAEIHARLLSLADGGTAILLISAELDELFALADRLVVLYRGRLVAEETLRGRSDAESIRARVGAAMLGATP